MLFDKCAELVLNGLDHLVPAVLGQGALEDVLEGLLLGRGGHGRRGVKHGIHEGLVALSDVSGVVEGPVEVGAALVKGGEEKAQLRGGHHPVGLQVVKLVLVDIVAQCGPGELYGADGAENVGIDLAGGVVLLLAVPGAVRPSRLPKKFWKISTVKIIG